MLAAQDVLEVLGLESGPTAPRPNLSPEAGAVLAVLADAAAALDEISQATGLGAPEVAVALTELELAGLVEGGDGLYRGRGT